MPRSVRPVGARSVAAAAPPLVVVDADDPLLPRVEAARLVGRAPATLRDWACRREGPPFLKCGSSRQARTLYRKSDLERWLSSCSRVVNG